MPAKTKKKPQQGRKYFCHSQVLSSSNLPPSIKELLHKERATFRKTVPTVILDKKDLKKCREVTTRMEKMMSVDKEGNASEVEVSLTSYDENGWRYYLKPEGLEDIEEFLSLLEMEVNFSVFDPENDDDEEVNWIEENLGMPAPEEKCVVMVIQDSFLFDDFEEDGPCGDPNCEFCNPDGDD